MRKALGPDEIPVEVLKLIKEQHLDSFDETQLESNISDTQFGFRNGYSTTGTHYLHAMSSHNAVSMSIRKYVCLIDYNKAFDGVCKTS